MPTPSHRRSSFTAKRIFTDRDEARALFAKQYSTRQAADEYRVLNFSGIGGQGKSALCGQFEQYLQTVPTSDTQQHAWAKLDFEDGNKRHPIAALLALRLQLAETGKLWFPAFDTAFARYFAITQAGRNLETSHPELFRQPHDLLQGLASIAETVTGLPLISKAIERLHKIDEKRILQQWLERRGNDLLQGLEVLPQYQLEEKLVVYFGADVDDWLHNTVNTPQRRIVLLYDTYEALWRDRPNKADLLVDKWVRKLVEETPGVLHVMLGREALTWANHDPTEWQDIITPYPLDNLTDTDADSFLQAVPIEEDDIRTRIVESAKGVPFYLSLQVDQYEGSKRRGIIPQVQDYGSKEPEILARFISHLPDAMRSALRVASYPRWLDETLFINLSEKFLGGAAISNLYELTAYSFWTKQDKRYFLHAAMRDYLQTENGGHDPVLFGQIHQHLFNHYDSKLQNLTYARDLTYGHAETLTEGAYHLEQLNRSKVPYWVGKYHGFFHLAAQWRTLESLLHLSLAILRNIGDKYGEGVIISNIGEINRMRGNYDAALNCYKQVLAITQQISDKSGEGLALNGISLIYSESGNYDAALECLKQALAITQQIDDKLSEGVTLNNMATLVAAYGEHDSALNFLKQALAITQQIDNKKGESTTLLNISQIFKEREDYDTALKYLKQALAIQQEIGDVAGSCTTLFNMGHIYWQNGEQNKAKQIWTKVYNNAKEIGYAQAILALKNIAGSSGLQAWETLAQQMENAEDTAVPD